MRQALRLLVCVWGWGGLREGDTPWRQSGRGGERAGRKGLGGGEGPVPGTRLGGRSGAFLALGRSRLQPRLCACVRVVVMTFGGRALSAGSVSGE